MAIKSPDANELIILAGGGAAALASSTTNVLLNTTRMEALGLAAGMSYARNWEGSVKWYVDLIPSTALRISLGAPVFCSRGAKYAAHLLQRDFSSPFRPENKFAGPGDVACCLAALDYLLKIARVSAVQFFQPPRSQNALSVGERSYSMPANGVTARKCFAWQ